MDDRLARIYIACWGMALVRAVAAIARDRTHCALLSPAYRAFLLRPWKVVTFVTATVLLAGAPYTGDPTWDHVDAVLMAMLTFTTAPWAVGVLRRALAGEPRARRAARLHGAVCAWLFSASWGRLQDALFAGRPLHPVRRVQVDDGGSHFDRTPLTLQAERLGGAAQQGLEEVVVRDAFREQSQRDIGGHDACSPHDVTVRR